MYQEIVLLIQSSSLFLSSANRFHLLLFLTVTVLFYQPSVIFLIFLVTRWRMTGLVLSLWGSLFQAFSELGRSAKNGEKRNKGKLNARRRLLFVKEKWQLKLIVIFFYSHFQHLLCQIWRRNPLLKCTDHQWVHCQRYRSSLSSSLSMKLKTSWFFENVTESIMLGFSTLCSGSCIKAANFLTFLIPWEWLSLWYLL